MISGFGREVDENCGLLCRYAVSSGNLLRTFRDNLSVQPSREYLEDGTERLFRNIGKKLPLLAL